MQQPAGALGDSSREVRPPGSPAAATYAASVVGLGAVSLLVQPLIALDHDTWYHLAHGRRILSGEGIPETSYFSFLTPERHWVDYYWLFGVVAASIERVAGALGLIVLRVSLFLITMTAVHRLVFAPRPLRSSSGTRSRGAGSVAPLWGAALVALVALALVGRYNLVRPHAISYTMIAVSLYIIEVRPRFLPLLPVLAVLWMNFHGIEYPVMLAVYLSYIGAFFVSRLAGGRFGGWLGEPGEPWTENGDRRLLWLTLACGSFLVTPHGLDLVRVPFVDTGFANTYIAELASISPREILTIGLLPPTLRAASNLMVVLLAIAGLLGVLRRPLPIAHLGLVAAGLVLIARSSRFLPEVALLGLPLLITLWPAAGTWPRPRPRIARALIGLVALLPVYAMVTNGVRFRHHHWPEARFGQPDGVARFLNQLGIGERVLNHPNQGGYFLWALDPRFEIATDMEVPFLFHDDDHYRVTSAFADPRMLRDITSEYRPDFIAAPIEATDFGGVVAEGAPHYEPVFFDDRVSLYVDTTRHSGVADSWNLAGIDPATLSSKVLEALEPGARDQLQSTLERMIEIAPEVDRPRRTLALVHWLAGRTSDALREARLAAEAAPWAWQPLVIQGNIELELGRPRVAARLLESALERDIDGATDGIHRNLAAAYDAAGNGRRAYRAFEKAVGRFPRRAPAEDLTLLGEYAVKARELDEARLYFEMARRKVPADNQPLIDYLDGLLSRMP